MLLLDRMVPPAACVVSVAALGNTSCASRPSLRPASATASVQQRMISLQSRCAAAKAAGPPDANAEHLSTLMSPRMYCCRHSAVCAEFHPVLPCSPVLFSFAAFAHMDALRGLKKAPCGAAEDRNDGVSSPPALSVGDCSEDSLCDATFTFKEAPCGAVLARYALKSDAKALQLSSRVGITGGWQP